MPLTGSKNKKVSKPNDIAKNIKQMDIYSKINTDLNSSNLLLKKQSFEFLLSLWNMGMQGRSTVLHLLENWTKNPLKSKFHRLVEELNTQNDGYKLVVMRLINEIASDCVEKTIQNVFEVKEFGVYFEKIKKSKNLSLQKEWEKFKHFEGKASKPNLENLKKLEKSKSLCGQITDQIQDQHFEVFLTILDNILKISIQEKMQEKFNFIAKKLQELSTQDSILSNASTQTWNNRINATTQTSAENEFENTVQNLEPAPVSTPTIPPPATITTQPPKQTQPKSVTILPPPPPPPMCFAMKAKKPSNNDIVSKHTSKLRSLRWRKIEDRCVKDNSLWSNQKKIKHISTSLDLLRMEKMFAEQEIKPSKESSNTKINKTKLLDPKRSLCVNVFIRQFRIPVDELIACIAQLDNYYFTGDQLKDLFSLLPTKEEARIIIEGLNNGLALEDGEVFLTKLIKLKNYELRVEAMLLMEEFTVSIENIKQSVDMMIHASCSILENEELHEFLLQILAAGNYLNYGKNIGNASGFSIFTLQQVWETRTNRARYSLLHCLIEDLESKGSSALSLPDGLRSLHKIPKVSIENMQKTVKNLKDHLQALAVRTDEVNDDYDLSEKIKNIKFNFNEEITITENSFKRFEIKRQELAAFFCESPAKFQLNEFFEIFKIFLVKFAQCLDDLKVDKLRRENEKRQKIKKFKHERQISYEIEADNEIFDILTKVGTNEGYRRPLRRHSKDFFSDQSFKFQRAQIKQNDLQPIVEEINTFKGSQEKVSVQRNTSSIPRFENVHFNENRK